MGKSIRIHRFALWFLASLGILTALYLFAAVVANPRGYFHPHIFPEVTWDSRGDKMKLFESYNREDPVEGLVLGSSRVMKIPPGELETGLNQRFFNFGVNNARTEDDLAIYRWVKRRAAHLKTILIGLDVEALHNNDIFNVQLLDNLDLSRALENGEKQGFRDRVNQFEDRMEKIMSRAYAKDIALSVLSAIKPPLALYAIDQNGLLHYIQFEKKLAAGTFRLQEVCENTRAKYIKRFSGMNSLSKQRCFYLEQLLTEARRDQMKVALWITPVRPDFERLLGSNTKYSIILGELRSYTKGLEKQFGVSVFDFSEQASFDGVDSDWYDDIHVNPANASRITAHVVNGLKDNGF